MKWTPISGSTGRTAQAGGTSHHVSDSADTVPTTCQATPSPTTGQGPSRRAAAVAATSQHRPPAHTSSAAEVSTASGGAPNPSTIPAGA